jgi:hypothetical protein
MPQKAFTITFCLAGLALWGSSQMSARGGAVAQTAQSANDAANTIETYCATCHNGRLRAPSGPLLDRLDASRIANNPELWSRAYRQLQAGAMPPAGSPRPDRATVDAVLIAIEQALETQAKPHLRGILLRYPEAFRTTITEKLLIFAAAGAVGPTSATPDSLVRARNILRRTSNPRWSTLIAAVIQ